MRLRLILPQVNDTVDEEKMMIVKYERKLAELQQQLVEREAHGARASSLENQKSDLEQKLQSEEAAVEQLRQKLGHMQALALGKGVHRNTTTSGGGEHGGGTAVRSPVRRRKRFSLAVTNTDMISAWQFIATGGSGGGDTNNRNRDRAGAGVGDDEDMDDRDISVDSGKDGKTDMEDGWEEISDDEGSDSYFYHTASGTTQWERPLRQSRTASTVTATSTSVVRTRTQSSSLPPPPPPQQQQQRRQRLFDVARRVTKGVRQLRRAGSLGGSTDNAGSSDSGGEGDSLASRLLSSSHNRDGGRALDIDRLFADLRTSKMSEDNTRLGQELVASQLAQRVQLEKHLKEVSTLKASIDTLRHEQITMRAQHSEQVRHLEAEHSTMSSDVRLREDERLSDAGELIEELRTKLARIAAQNAATKKRLQQQEEEMARQQQEHEVEMATELQQQGEEMMARLRRQEEELTAEIEAAHEERDAVEARDVAEHGDNVEKLAKKEALCQDRWRELEGVTAQADERQVQLVENERRVAIATADMEAARNVIKSREEEIVKREKQFLHQRNTLEAKARSENVWGSVKELVQSNVCGRAGAGRKGSGKSSGGDDECGDDNDDDDDDGDVSDRCGIGGSGGGLRDSGNEDQEELQKKARKHRDFVTNLKRDAMDREARSFAARAVELCRATQRASKQAALLKWLTYLARRGAAEAKAEQQRRRGGDALADELEAAVKMNGMYVWR